MPEDPHTFHFVADKGDARRRLDHILVRRVTDISRFSRTTAQQWVDSGAVCVDGIVVTRPAARLREGAAVEVTFPPTAIRRMRPAAEDHELTVVYEDEALLIVDKMAGVVVHPSYKQLSGTLLNAILWRVRGRDGVQPGIVTRLDKDTSGLVIVALTPQVHATIQQDASTGAVQKRYLAIVDGVPQPGSGRITQPIGRDPDDRRRMTATGTGIHSETLYQVLSTHAAGAAQIAVVACTLVTGRTHQIRVHLSASGWPVTGDRVYGQAHPLIARHALHAWRVTLPHPLTRQPLSFESAMPQDMLALLARHSTMPATGDAHHTEGT